MCGITGEFRYDSSPTSADWDTIVDLAQRRGPDDKGIWGDNKHCTLGFRRLAILDLSPTGHQPMLTADERYALVFNGELYNFRSVKEELERLGVRFRSSGDTEVVLYALAIWGVEALARFNGMFAIAFYDRQEKTLLLARDHAGIKPLYYTTHTNGVAFASQYNQILAHTWGKNLQVSTDALAMYFAHLYIPAPFALHENTHMLEAGTWLKIHSDRSSKSGRYYEFTIQDPTLYGDEAIEAVDAAITDAVKRQLISDVPLGTFLSGGIDSPLVTAKVQSLTNHDVLSYSIGVPGFAGDESEDATRYANELGITQKLHHFSAETAQDQLKTVIEATTAPFADYSIFPTMKVAEAARQDVTVILSGDGGDEMFWGYKRSLDVLKYAPLYNLPQFARKPLAYAARQLGGAHFARVSAQPDLNHWFSSQHHSFPQKWLQMILPDIDNYSRPPTESYPQTSSREDVSQWLRKAEFEHYLPEVLMKVDRASMYHSLEVRVPLLDREVLDVAQKINWETCVDLDTFTGKIPLRKALAKHVSQQTTTKRGFSVPMENWLRTSLKEIFEDTVLSRESVFGVPLDRAHTTNFFNAHLNEEINVPGPLWSLLSLVLWEDQLTK